MKGKQTKNIMRGVAALAVLFLVSIGIYVYATQNVEIKVVQTPNVDVILTKSKTKVDTKEFETKLKEELIKQNVMTEKEIEAGKLNIQAIEAQTMETQDKIPWTQNVNSSIGTLTLQNEGKDVTMTGNQKNPGKNAIYITPNATQEQEFEFGYSINFGDSFNAAGMLLRVEEKENGHLQGYMLSFNKSDKQWYKTAQANAALWEFDYQPNTNGTAFSIVNNENLNNQIKLIQSVKINLIGNLKIKITSKNIIISEGGLEEPVEYIFEEGKEYGDGYGFFSDHYGHNCDQKGAFTLTNIKLKVEAAKKFSEVLQAPTWRDGAQKVIINVEDKENEQFSNKEELTEIIAKLMNNDIYYIGWGTEDNKEQIENLIKQNDSKGTYIANTSEEAIQATVDYIKTLILRKEATNTVIAGEHVLVEQTSPALPIPTPTKEFPNGVWRVDHDYEYYENPEEQYEYDDMYSNDLINSFDHVGKYTIYCEDNYVTTIYAHRRPVSTFKMKIESQQVKLNSNSYDLDIEASEQSTIREQQKANKGIKTEKWEYKKISDEESTWETITETTNIGNEVTLEDLEEEAKYMIKLTVTDYQGAETSSVKYIAMGESDLKPVASFKVVDKTISVYDKLDIIDESYDPCGQELTYHWVVKKDGEKEPVYTGADPLTNFNTNQEGNGDSSKYGPGTYTIELTVSKTIETGTELESAPADEVSQTKTITSDVFSQKITVTDDITAPTITVTPTKDHKYNEEIHIQVSLKDEESGLKSLKYAFLPTKEETEQEETENVDKEKTRQVRDTGEAEEPDEEERTEGDIYTEVHLSGNEATQEVTIPATEWDENLYLHIIAEDNAGVKSEERITGEYYIEPTYKLVVQAIDNQTKNAIQNAKYDIIGEYEDGSTIELIKGATTDSNGKITIEKAKLHEVVGIKIDNVEAVSGYEQAEYKNVQIDTSEHKIIVDSTTTSEDVEAQTSDEDQTLTVKVPIDKKQFELKVTNIDSISKNYISNSIFVLKQNGEEIAKGETVDGIVTLKGYIAGVKQEGEYILEQTSVHSTYKKIGTTTLKIKFDKDGNVEKISETLFGGNKNVEIPDATKPEVVVKNERQDTTSFSVHMNIKEDKNLQPLEGSTYKIRVDTEDNLEYTTEAVTSDNQGNITINGLFGTGKLRLTFVNEKAVAGYAKDTPSKSITINRDTNQTITLKSESESGLFEKVENHTIFVNLKQTVKPSMNALRIKVFANEEQQAGVDGIGISIYEVLNNTLIGTGTTNEEGVFEVTGVTLDGTGDVLYKIVPDDNTIIDSTIIFSVGYNKQKQIISASNITSHENIAINYTEEDGDVYYKHVANVNIGITPGELEGENTLTIIKKDAITGEVLTNVQEQVKITGLTTSINVYTTDGEGKIQTKLPDTNQIAIQLKEVQNAVGYRADNIIKSVVLTRNEEGQLQISSLNNLAVDKVTLDSEGNLTIIEGCRSLDSAAVSFKLATTNEKGTLNLGGVQFKITEETTGYSEIVVTNASGYVTVPNQFVTTEGKSYTFIIEEIQTVFPYKKLESPIKVQVRFTKQGPKVTYEGTTYLQGEDFLSEKQASYDAQNNQLDISLKVMNEISDQLGSGLLYDIDLVKLDKDGNVVSGSEYNVEIRPYAESCIVSNACEVIDGIEIANLAIQQDKTTIILKEVTPAIGCNIDSDIKTVTLQIDNTGKIAVVNDTTSTTNMRVELQEDRQEGKTIVKIIITEEQNTGGTGGNQGGNQGGGEEESKPQPKVTFHIFNRNYGDWEYKHYERKIPFRNSYFRSNWNNAILSGAQKLLRIFDTIPDNGRSNDADSHDFGFINPGKVIIEARLINNEVVDTDIYETVELQEIESPSNEKGNYQAGFMKDYANKKVEFTIVEKIPAINHKRHTIDSKFIVEFDSNGKVLTGDITQGVDLEDLAIGGISENGIIDNIQIINTTYYKGGLKYGGIWHVDWVASTPFKTDYTTCDIKDYNSIGKNELYLGIINKTIEGEDGKLKVNVNLLDEDTNEGVDANVSLIAMDETEDNKIVETKNVTINSSGEIKLDNIYANRKLLFVLQQVTPATKGTLNYIDKTAYQIKFEVEFDDDGNIINYNPITQYDHVKGNAISATNTVDYTIYNSLKYNFALNLTKLDENDKPLKGVRVQNVTSLITDNGTLDSQKIFEYGSQLTDENGKTKLKIVLPTTGTNKYYGRTIEIELNEYYVPDNYRAEVGRKIRVTFDRVGNITDYKTVQEDDSIITLTGKDHISPEDLEKISVDLTMKNSRVEEKPVITIENVDADNENTKIEGTKYQIEVMDIQDYAINNLNINERLYSQNTDNEGKTTVNFENAHALRTMIYRLKEVQTADSYKKNEDIILKVQFDKDGKVAGMPEILNGATIKNSRNEEVDVATVVGTPEGSTTITLKIVNELQPKFTLNIRRQDTEGNQLTGREFTVTSEEKGTDGNYTQQEIMVSHETATAYEVGFRQDPANKTIRYTITEKVGTTTIERGKVELTFDKYGNVQEGSALDGEQDGKYIKSATILENKDYITVTIEAEIFRMGIEVVDQDNAGFSLKGYTFEITNSKGEKSDVTVATNVLGNVIEIVGECYKGETIDYTIKQVDSPIDYNDIAEFSIKIAFDKDGQITSCTPESITDSTTSKDLYKLVTTQKTENVQMQMKLYATAARRNSLKMTLLDDKNNSGLSNSSYSINEDKFQLNIEDGNGQTDLGSYKNYAGQTVVFTITQTQADDKYMINDKPIQVSATFDNEGLITSINELASDSYVQIDKEKTVGSENIVLTTKNRRKEIMDLEVYSTQSSADKVYNATFKIIEQGKSDLYSDTKVTDMKGQAKLYVGPYYTDTSKEVTYLITNTKQAKEFKKLPDSSFTLKYNEDGTVASYTIPQSMQQYMSIQILNDPANTADIKITMKTDPLFTVGVIARDKVTNAQLIGGKFEIVQADKQQNKDTVITTSNAVAHAAVGESEKGKTVTYNIIEKDAPNGYKYNKGQDQVVGVLRVAFDAEGHIIKDQCSITQGYDYIKIESASDKNSNYDIDLTMTYEETEEFKVIIEDYDIISDTTKLQATFQATLTNEDSVSMTTDPITGTGTLNFGKIKHPSSTKILTISQSNIQGSYATISPIKLHIKFDESGKIKSQSVEAMSGSGIAQLNQVYTIDSISNYTIKLTVKNNPKTVIKIKNVSDGESLIPIDSTMVLSAANVEPITMTTTDGEGQIELSSTPKNTRVTYTIAQTNVPRGYTKNKDIRLVVTYDNNGKITSAYPETNSTSYADARVVKVEKYDSYQIELLVKNKREFEIYLEAQDAFDSNIKLSNVLVNILQRMENTLSQQLKTDENGVAYAKLGSTYANESVTYEVNINNNLPGYDTTATSIRGNIRVRFDNNGDITGDIISDNPLIEASNKNGNAIEVTVKYIPFLKLNVTRRNTMNNAPLSGRRMTIAPPSNLAQPGFNPAYGTTNANGQINIQNAGLIQADNTVEYTITEQPVTGYTSIETLGKTLVYVTYDENGKIARVTSSDTDHVSYNENDIGTRVLNLEIGSDAKSSIAIVDADYYISTQRIKGSFEITSSKGETMTISSTVSKQSIVEKLGRLYPGEKIEYTIHQTEVAEGYQVIPDTKFTVEYNDNGTIKEVLSENQDVVEIKKVNEISTDVQANINIEIHSKPQLLIDLEVVDKQYYSGVYGMEFKVKENGTAVETTVQARTDDDGHIRIPVNSSYRNAHATYTITNTKAYGGYQLIPSFEVIVQYGDLGNVEEQGTHVINTDNASVVQNYSADLFMTSKLRGIKVKVNAETHMGIGIEKTSVDGSKMAGVEFTVSARDITDPDHPSNPEGIKNATNDAGELVHYFGSLPKNKTMEYTISEVQAPAGYRKAEDIVIRVYYDAEGRITSYTVDKQPSHVTIEVATNMLYKMTASNETVHIKVNIVNDNRMTFKIVNTEENVQLPIEGAEFEISIDTEAGNTVRKETKATNINGEATLEDIEGSGTIRIHFNQTKVPEGYAENTKNHGYITIDKSADIYKLTYKESTDDLKYEVDSEKGIVTIYLQNKNNMLLNIFDVDAETQNLVRKGTHTVTAYAGEKENDFETITKGEEITYNNGQPYESKDGVLSISLGDTYQFKDKKVIYKITTPTPPEKYEPITEQEPAGEGDPEEQQAQEQQAQEQQAQEQQAQEQQTQEAQTAEAQGQETQNEVDNPTTAEPEQPPVEPQEPTEKERYSTIGDVYIIVEYDSKGRVETVNGKSVRLLYAKKGGDHMVNAVIGYGDIDFYTIKIVKEDMTGNRINGAKFDINLQQDDKVVQQYPDQVTANKVIADEIIEQGMIELTNLKEEGNIRLTLTEKEIPAGYVLMKDPIEITFHATLDDEDPDAILLKVSNVQSQNATVEVNEEARMMTITIKNEPTITLTLNKKDNNENSLMGMKFNLTVQKKGTNEIETYDSLTTNEEGKIEANIKNQYSDESILIRLEEEKPENYKAIKPIILEAYINKEGKIQTLLMNSGQDNAKVTKATEGSIELDVVNELEEYAKPYSIHITKLDENDEEIALAGALLQVKVTPSTGTSVYKAVYTDKNGNVDLRGLIGSGDIAIEIKEVTAPNGYILEDNEGYFTYKISKVNGSLQKVDSNQEDSLWNIDNNNKIVNIKIQNNTQKIGIAVEKVDSINKNIKIAGASFKLTDKNGKEYEATTNNNGIASFAVEKPKEGSNGVVTYTLQEVAAPQGYELDSTEHQIIINYKQGKLDENIILGDDLTLIEKNDNYIKVQVVDKQQMLSIGGYNLEVMNRDKETKTPIENATFEMRIEQTLGAAYLKVTEQTNKDGKININEINGAGDITINLVNTIEGNGYAINSNNNTVTFHRNEKTGAITITQANNVTAEYDELNNTIRIYIESEKEQNKYSLKLNIVNRSDGSAIKDTSAKYKITIGDNALEKNVNEDGQIILSGLDIAEVNNFTIQIQELQAPQGFTSITDVQELHIDVASVYNVRTLKEVTVVGNNAQISAATGNSIDMNIWYDSSDIDSYYIKSDIYQVTETSIEKVKPNTTIDEFLHNIDTNGSMKVYGRDGNEKVNPALVGTGDLLKVNYNGIIYEYDIVVLGDLNGDGKVTITDISMLNQSLVGKTKLNELQEKAADVDFSGKVSITDFSKLNKVLTGKDTL